MDIEYESVFKVLQKKVLTKEQAQQLQIQQLIFQRKFEEDLQNWIVQLRASNYTRIIANDDASH